MADYRNQAVGECIDALLALAANDDATAADRLRKNLGPAATHVPSALELIEVARDPAGPLDDNLVRALLIVIILEANRLSGEEDEHHFAVGGVNVVLLGAILALVIALLAAQAVVLAPVVALGVVPVWLNIEKAHKKHSSVRDLKRSLEFIVAQIARP